MPQEKKKNTLVVEHLFLIKEKNESKKKHEFLYIVDSSALKAVLTHLNTYQNI